MQDVLDSELLRTFLTIVDHGSFNAAAERVHRTQSAVSMQMRRLEALVGQPLFQREGRGMQLTAAGELLVGHARRILQAHRDALTAFATHVLEGRVTLGTPDDYAVGLLPRILARFAVTHPRVQVDIVFESSRNLLARVEAGEVDLALVSNHPAVAGRRVLRREPAVWVTSPLHCAHEHDPLPLALFHPGCVFRQWALDALGQQGRRYRVACTSVSMAAIRAAVEAGLAVSVVGLSSVPDSLRILDAADGFPPLPEHEIALQRDRSRPSPLLDQLEAHIVDSFRRGEVTVPA